LPSPLSSYLALHNLFLIISSYQFGSEEETMVTEELTPNEVQSKKAAKKLAAKAEKAAKVN
jgi:hypothetical protein